MVEKFKNNGFVILDNTIEDVIFNKINTLSNYYIERTLQRNENSGNILYNLFRTENLIYDFPAPEIFNNEPIYEFVKKILGFNFRLTEVLIFFSEPNNHLQNLHSDQHSLFDEKIILPTSKVSVQIPLIDFNFNNGATRIVPNTHNLFLNTEDILKIEDEIKNDISFTPNVNIKSCLIRDVRTLHGAGINKSNKRRAMLVLVYTKKWLSPLATVSKDLYFSIDKNKRHV
ncbi:MAG TPA: hypothetical protein DCS17_03880, partial [Flavobacterium sp.]|nr:hypothetical protein [Flavobacterium sp.]